MCLLFPFRRKKYLCCTSALFSRLFPLSKGQKCSMAQVRFYKQKSEQCMPDKIKHSGTYQDEERPYLHYLKVKKLALAKRACQQYKSHSQEPGAGSQQLTWVHTQAVHCRACVIAVVTSWNSRATPPGSIGRQRNAGLALRFRINRAHNPN